MNRYRSGAAAPSPTRRSAALATALALALAAAPTQAATGAAGTPRLPDGEASPGVHERLVREGVAIDVAMAPVAPESSLAELRQGDPVRVRLTITDSHSGAPLSSLYPAAWMDRLPPTDEPTAGDTQTCQQKVEAFVGGSLLAQPEADLNVYYVLALNDDATISVVDPLFGFGGSKLLEMVFLASPGDDWELTADQRHLFVSMPDADKVAVVDTAEWRVSAEVEVGAAPSRLLLQPDEHYLWVAWEGRGDGPSGVSVVDTRRLVEVARIETGRGPHDLAASDDDRLAFVANRGDGTVTVVDIQTLKKVRNVVTGGRPASLAYSGIGQALYVTDPAGGTITVVDGVRAETVARITAEPGIQQIRFAPGGRLGFVVNPQQDAVHILDTAGRRIVQTADVEDEPYEVAFSDELAYVAHRGSEIILMIPLEELGREGAAVPAIDFPGGQHPPGRTAQATRAETIIQAPGATAVLVANPGDRAIYYYKEGMAAPMGHFKNYGRRPRAVMVVDRSLQEVTPGVYETAVKLRRPGRYDLAVFVDAPRVIHCIPFRVEADPALTDDASRQPVAVELRAVSPDPQVGREVLLKVRVADRGTGEPTEGLKDVRVLAFLAPGIWQQRLPAAARRGGIYEVRFTPPRPGIYYAFVEIPSQGVQLNRSPSLTLQVAAPETDPTVAARARQP